MATTLPVVYHESNQVEVLEALDALRQQNYNVVTPQTLLVAPNYRLRFDFIQINPNPLAGEVFKVGSQSVPDKDTGKDRWVEFFCLGKTALDRIARSINVLWNPRETKTLFMSNVTIVFQAVGIYRLSTGDVAMLTGTKEIDLLAIEEEVRVEQTLKVLGGKWKPKAGEEALYAKVPPEEIINSLVRREMAMWRKNRLMRAETGAKERAIRSGMALKSRYTKEELQRPFVVPVVEYNPKSDIVREMISKETAVLFGTPPAAAPALSQRPQTPTDTPRATFTAGPETGEGGDVETGDGTPNYVSDEEDQGTLFDNR